MNIQSYQTRLDMLVNCNIYESLTNHLNKIIKMEKMEDIKKQLSLLLEEIKYTYIEMVIKDIIENDNITKKEIEELLQNYRYKSLCDFIKLYNESIFY